MPSTFLAKTILYKSLAEGVYRDVVTKSSSYYYFLGKTLSWADDNNPPYPVDSLAYEHNVRNEIITIKEIKPSDIAFVIPRKNWISDVVYDMYDDEYCDEVLGIDLISGGSGYIDILDPVIEITGGGGSGATAIVTEIISGMISKVVLTNRGSGYVSTPTVTVISGSGSGAELKATMGIAPSGAQKIEDANFYVVTDEYNVYKCLDNNNNAPSTYKPTGTQLEPIKTLDGYIWKFMYSIPINLRNKFFTDEYIPVVTALTSHFYTNGTVDNIFIANRGTGYSSAVLSVSGDGYRESDPIFINSVQVTSPGTGYTNPTITFSPPFTGASEFIVGNSVNLGQKLYNVDTGDYYEVISPGTLSQNPPTHKYGNVVNGTATLKYTGSNLKGVAHVTNPKNITGITVDVPGAGYTSVPTVTVTDSTGTGCTAHAVIGSSPLQSVQILNGGTNYVSPILTVIGGGGAGAVVQAVVSSGVISSVLIINPGSGYTSTPTIGVEDTYGNGASLNAILEGSPVLDIIVDTPGSGYTNPTVTIIGGGGAGATADATVETNILQSVSLIGGVREIVILNSGTGYLSVPNVYLNGGGGTGALAKCKLSADRVTTTYILEQGENYTTSPSVQFGDSWQPYLEVYANDQFVNDGVLYTVTNKGVVGSLPPTHSTGTVVSSAAWQAGHVYDVDDTVYVSDRLYKVMQAGTTSGTAPTHTSGDVADGSTVLRYLGAPAYLRRDGSAATGYTILRYGAGYSVTPEATITDETGYGAVVDFFTAKSDAKLSAVTENGQISYVVIEDPGVGYTKATITVTGSGTGASLIPDLSLGSISSQQANNEILTPSGTIDAIAIVSRGYSYGVANVIIEGDGDGATAEAVIDPATNSIRKINITNRGQDYTYANVKIIGNGNGAELRAIITPYGGHGKVSPEELFSRTLMFYSNISTDLNQGVVVGNDYRQVGILKNPRIFDGFENFESPLGSACYIIQSPIDVTRFARDDNLYIERVKKPQTEWVPSLEVTLNQYVYYGDRIYTTLVSGVCSSTPPTTTTGSEINGTAIFQYVGSTRSKKRYRIVSVTDLTALVQSLDNDIPDANDVFIKTSSITDSFTAVTVGLPSFDKYSGQLLYIDNKQGFTPSADETITLRTIIKF